LYDDKSFNEYVINVSNKSRYSSSGIIVYYEKFIPIK